MPQEGYNMTFQPFSKGKPSGDVRSVRQRFHGEDSADESKRCCGAPDGVAQAPDGSLYITDSQKGKIWRVMYKGGK